MANRRSEGDQEWCRKARQDRIVDRQEEIEDKAEVEVELTEETPFKQWLEDSDKMKWKKAWQGFWKEEGFLKDVGI